MNADDAIDVSDLAKRFGTVLAVDHISFKVKKEELFGFLGPNGAGKTTTMRMLTGIIRPDAGTARIMNYDILEESLKAKEIMGIVPEVSNAYVDFSAWANLMLIGELYGVPKRERRERAGELLEKLGLYERRNQCVRGFSKGMSRRLVFCMALINEPQILFLDEPTIGLDVESSRLIRDWIRECNEKGVTVFLTTHNMQEASQLCDRIAIINHGRIAAIDTPEKLRMESRGLQSVEVSFDKPVNIQRLSRIKSVLEVKKMGDKGKLYTEKPSDVIAYLIDYAKSNNLRIISLNTLAPTLEDVFVKLTRGH